MCLAQGNNIVTPQMMMVKRGKLVAMIGADKAFGSSISQELEVRSLYHPYSLKAKSSQCQYVVMTRSET